MDYDHLILEAILLANKYCNNRNNILIIGYPGFDIKKISSKYYNNIPKNIIQKYSDNFFKYLGFKNINSIDSYYFQNPITNSNTKYNFILNGGSFENIFNITQVFENIINSLDIDGIFCSVTCCNNIGFYQFSPKLFYETFAQTYGMTIQKMYSAKPNTPINQWDPVLPNQFQINKSDTDTYLITIAKKISNDRKSLLQYFPKYNNLLFISAFQDIGRTKWGDFKRSTSDYVSIFGNIIKNISNLICFCENDIAKDLNDQFNFKNSFPYDKDKSYYCFLQKETEIMNSDFFNSLIEHRKNHPECFCPEYNIVNHNKIIFIQRAKRMFPNYTHYCWIDFGYGAFTDDSFTFKGLDPSKLSDKIYYATCSLPDNTNYNPIDNCQVPLDLIQGSMFTIPNHLVEWYLNEYTKAILHFQSLNIVDDDQAIVLFIYINNPDKFELYLSQEWFRLINTIERN